MNNGLKRLISKHVGISRAAQDSEYDVTLATENPINDGNELDLKVEAIKNHNVISNKKNGST